MWRAELDERVLRMSEDVEASFIAAIDAAVRRAEFVMDLGDVPDEGDAASDEAGMLAFEERFHCGTCVVRTVMDEVWPPIESYINYLSHKHD